MNRKMFEMSSIKLISMSVLFAGTVLAVLLAISGCSRTYDGEKLYFQEGCSQCHTFRGRGGRMGPDLSAVTNIRSENWLDNYIKNPQEVYPFSRMPSFDHLSRGKRKAIILFLKN